MLRIAINGFGRIGRNVVRAIYESQRYDQIEIVAINDLGEARINAHLLQYDTAHGRFGETVTALENEILVGENTIKVFSERSPADLPWGELEIDLVMECTGFFSSREQAAMHIEAGAKQVLISAPGANADATIVYGVNDSVLSATHQVVSNASCTTNCLAPIAAALHTQLGITKGLANTIHAYTNDQRLNDVYHTDLRRARAAGHSMIPSETGAAAAIGLVIPELDGRLDGLSVRVPTLNVSLLDLTVNTARPTSVAEVNEIISATAAKSKKSILAVNNLPLVSSDFNHNPASSIVDVTQTKVQGDLVKILAWYDNEWGFSNRMIDTALAMGAVAQESVRMSKAS